MVQNRVAMIAVTVCACVVLTTLVPVVSAGHESPKYQQGFNPAETHGDQIGTIPDEAWGEVVNGLQAAISAPDRIRMNDVVTIYVVVRNVSKKTIRLSLPQHPGLLGFQRDGTTISHRPSRPGVQVMSWELKPGHQTIIPSAPTQVVAPGDLGLKRALTMLTPGPHTLYAGIGTTEHWWVAGPDGIAHKVFPRKGEWTGWLSMPRKSFELLAEKVPFNISPLQDLPAGHGLQHVIGTPTSLNRGRTEWLQLRDGLGFALDGSQDAHWLLDGGTYNQVVWWGPIPAAKLQELRLLDRIRQACHEYMQTADYNFDVEGRIEVLVSSEKPLAAMGLQFVPTMKLPNPQQGIPSDYLARTIRDRRVELEQMGLADPMQQALNVLTANDAPMPDDSQFTVVSSKESPPGLNEKSWGPKNAGLQAAVLMPDSIRAEATENVRLFIRNVSDHEVRLAVSERTGYDYATARGVDGHRLTTVRPYVYPGAFASVIRPELNPVQTTQSPSTATLQKVLLKPGAVLELETRTGLSFHMSTKGTGSFIGLTQETGKPAVTHISATPMTARVTWHLHTANGAIHSKDLKQRLWPAKGSWSGILTTAPVEIRLRP